MTSGDPRDLADAVVALLADESRRRALGNAARRLAQERYSWEQIARRLGGIYERLARGSAVRAAA